MSFPESLEYLAIRFTTRVSCAPIRSRFESSFNNQNIWTMKDLNIPIFGLLKGGPILLKKVHFRNSISFKIEIGL